MAKKVHELEIMQTIRDYLEELDGYDSKLRVMNWVMDYSRSEHMKTASLVGGAIGNAGFAQDAGVNRLAERLPTARETANK